jgi:hypothetical protein
VKGEHDSDKVAALEMSSHAIEVAAKAKETVDRSPSAILAELARLARDLADPYKPESRLRG